MIGSKFGRHFENYVSEFSEEKGRYEAFERTALNFTQGEIASFNHKSRINGLLFGEVQSGKTSHTFAAIAGTADIDEGFNTFVYLSTDNVKLQEQTYSRAISALSTFQVCDESDELRFKASRLNQPVVVVLKKNVHVLAKWLQILQSSDRVKTSPIFIVDDEGDAAALNTKVNRDDESAIYRLISEMRELGTSSIYLQVTATPQALFLQSEIEQLKPQFAKFFEPGEGYLGGDFFFGDLNRPINYFLNETDLDEALTDPGLSPGLSHFLSTFLITCAHLEGKGWSNVNGLVHPAVAVGIHNQLAGKLKKRLSEIQDPNFLQISKAALEAGYHELKKSTANMKPIEVLVNRALRLKVNIKIMNSSEPTDKAGELGTGFNIFVGANILGRGVTFPHLQTIYYSRQSKTPQFDTAWQHSRMFGYDRDPETVRVFMSPVLFRMFHVLHEANNLLKNAIHSGKLNDLQVIIPKSRIKPTRSGVIRSSAYSLLVGGANYFPPEPNQDNLRDLQGIFAGAQEGQVSQIDLNVARTLIRKASSNGNGWPVERLIRAIEQLTDQYPKIEIWSKVSFGRQLSANTGTMLSESDRKLVAQTLGDHFVFTVYEVTGDRDKGWQGRAFWMVNLRLPNGFVYHAVSE